MRGAVLAHEAAAEDKGKAAEGEQSSAAFFAARGLTGQVLNDHLRSLVERRHADGGERGDEEGEKRGHRIGSLIWRA